MNLSLSELTGPVAIVELGVNGARLARTVLPFSGASKHALTTHTGSVNVLCRAARQVLPDATSAEVDALTLEQLQFVLWLAHEPIDRVMAWIADDPQRKDENDAKPNGEGLMPRDPIGYVLARVAQETARSVLDLADDPYALTLWTFAQLGEIERFSDLRRMGDRLDLSYLTAIAFHEPKKLTQAAHRYESLAGLLPSVDDVKARGLELINAERATRGSPPLHSWDQNHDTTRRI